MHGFRFDAVKHITHDFFPEWLGKLRANNRMELFAVGEYWHSDINVLQEYLNSCGRCMSLFDVPLHFHFFEASNSNGEYDMRNLLNGTLVEREPTLAVTFVDNHDTQTGQALESAIQPWFVPIAYSVILLRPTGYPCIFYGNYYGVKAKNGPAFAKEIDIMMDVRRRAVFGPIHDYFDDPDLVGWAMEGKENGPGVAVLLTNRRGDTKTMYVGSQHAKEIWHDVLGNVHEEVRIDENGYGSFCCADGSVSVFVESKRD